MQAPSKNPTSISWQALFSVLMFGFMYLPILVLGFYSFNLSPNSAQWGGFTLSWYVKFFNDSRILSALSDSLKVAFCAVGISAIIGTLMAVGLARYKIPWQAVISGCVISSLDHSRYRDRRFNVSIPSGDRRTVELMDDRCRPYCILSILRCVCRLDSTG